MNLNKHIFFPNSSGSSSGGGSGSGSNKASISNSGNSSSSRSHGRSSRREKSSERVRERSREREKPREVQRERTPRDEPEEIETFDLTTRVDKEEEQKRLEQEMTKRRDRIERWRAERKRKELENKKVTERVVPVPSAKKWSLENESDDDEDVKEVPMKDVEMVVVQPPAEPPQPPPIQIVDDPPPDEMSPAEHFLNGRQPNLPIGTKDVGGDLKSTGDDALWRPEQMDADGSQPESKWDQTGSDDDDIDPLDAYMLEVHKEVRKANKISKPANSSGNGGSSGVMVMSGIAKKNTESKKGEMMEQNQDGLEYSSEEEIEDIKDTAANLANKHKKELAKIDHSSVNYLPFRKNFYVEVPELAKMTPAEVDAYKVELEGIQVKGKGCPKPIKTWAHCGISKKEMDVLKRLQFEKPTPIQCQAIPAIMSGRDLIGIAKTGSGKTLAFILPMFRHILDQPVLEDGDGPVAIIMAPTRELCMQIGKDIKKFSKSLNLRAVCVYGGTGISEQIAELKRGAEVVVCTPGRMIDMLAANSSRVTNLRRVTYIVLDEADRMFDMGFEPQVSDDQ